MVIIERGIVIRRPAQLTNFIYDCWRINVTIVCPKQTYLEDIEGRKDNIRYIREKYSEPFDHRRDPWFVKNWLRELRHLAILRRKLKDGTLIFQDDWHVYTREDIATHHTQFRVYRFSRLELQSIYLG
jgi:hypothetical protein